MAAVERLVNLALLLAASRRPISVDGIRSEGIYPEGQEDSAFLRMFERDKDDLRGMGFVIDVDENGAYRLDARNTFASPIELSPSEASVVRVASAALLDDPSFPFADDLRLALTKVTAETSGDDMSVAARLADEDPQHQGEAVAVLSAAAASNKRVGFGYTNSLGVSGPHEVEPFGLFLHDGRWYLVGRDVAKDEVRTYAVTRMTQLVPNAFKPRTPDFQRPDDFDISVYTRLPFQYGRPADEFRAQVHIDAPAGWRAAALTSSQGTLIENGDGSYTWTVNSRSEPRFLRFIIENGPGLRVAAPARLAEALRKGLAEVEALHG